MINDLRFLIPLVVGLMVFALAFRFSLPMSPGGNRVVFGLLIMLTALCWWAGTAILLVSEHRFFAMLDFVTVFTFFLGLLCFIPKVKTPGKNKFQLGLLYALLFIGVALGVAHGIAMSATNWWPARLLGFYGSLGLK